MNITLTLTDSELSHITYLLELEQIEEENRDNIERLDNLVNKIEIAMKEHGAIEKTTREECEEYRRENQ